MSQQPVIDGFEFASAGALQEGTWPIRDFPRVRDMLASDAGEVEYSIAGVRDERGRPALRVKVAGMLQLRCQRCLEAMPFALRTDETLVLAHTQEEIDAEPVDVHARDRVLAGKAMPVRELIEDELILAVPYALRHERCSGPETRAGERTSPFAALRRLMDGKH